jgi:hypothetical protein
MALTLLDKINVTSTKQTLSLLGNYCSELCKQTLKGNLGKAEEDNQLGNSRWQEEDLSMLEVVAIIREVSIKGEPRCSRLLRTN